MDLGQATLLVVAVYGVVELGKALIGEPYNTNPRILVLLVLAVSFAMTFLVAETAWADEQVIGEVPMSEMTTASLVLVSLLVAGAQTLVSTGVGALRNFGRGDPVPVQKGLPWTQPSKESSSLSPSSSSSSPQSVTEPLAKTE